MTFNKQEWFQKNGFNEAGETFVVISSGGNTYDIKDELKEKGCKFNGTLKWHSPQQFDLPQGFNFLPLAFEDICYVDISNSVFYNKGVTEKIQAAEEALLPESKSEYMGIVGQRLYDLKAVFKSANTFAGAFGYSVVYTFMVGENKLNWFTASTPKINLEPEDSILLTGTVKKHSEYRKEKITTLSRCILKKEV